MTTTSKKNREMLPGKIYDSLHSARTANGDTGVKEPARLTLGIRR